MTVNLSATGLLLVGDPGFHRFSIFFGLEVTMGKLAHVVTVAVLTITNCVNALCANGRVVALLWRPGGGNSRSLTARVGVEQE